MQFLVLATQTTPFPLLTIFKFSFDYTCIERADPPPNKLLFCDKSYLKRPFYVNFMLPKALKNTQNLFFINRNDPPLPPWFIDSIENDQMVGDCFPEVSPYMS